MDQIPQVAPGKTCSCCRKTLPVQAFGRNRQTPDGLHYYCRFCAAEKQRAWTQRYPEKAKAVRLAYLDRIRKLNGDRDPYAA